MDKEIFEADIIYPPTADQIQDLRTHNVGLAIRLASKLGRPLEDWEYEMFRKEQTKRVYEIVELPNKRFGIV
jgi:hypothetical protein